MAIFRLVRRLFFRVLALADVAMVVGAAARQIRGTRGTPGAASARPKTDLKSNPQLMIALLSVGRMLLRWRKNRRRRRLS